MPKTPKKSSLSSLRDKMDRKVEPVIRKMVQQGIGASRISDHLNEIEEPYYRKLPLKYFFYAGTPKKVIDSFRSKIRKRGIKYALTQRGSEDFSRYFRSRRNPAPWTSDKVRGVCKRTSIEFLARWAYAEISHIHQRREEKIRYLKRSYGSRALTVIDFEKRRTDRRLKILGNTKWGKPQGIDAVIARFEREARMRASG